MRSFPRPGDSSWFQSTCASLMGRRAALWLCHSSNWMSRLIGSSATAPSRAAANPPAAVTNDVRGETYSHSAQSEGRIRLDSDKIQATMARSTMNLQIPPSTHSTWNNPPYLPDCCIVVFCACQNPQVSGCSWSVAGCPLASIFFQVDVSQVEYLQSPQRNGASPAWD